jgi:hypothetical protein
VDNRDFIKSAANIRSIIYIRIPMEKSRLNLNDRLKHNIDYFYNL